MCSIIGWGGNVSIDEKRHILRSANERGRDGYGFSVDGKTYKGLSSSISKNHKVNILRGSRVLGNFRATPTTEAESKVEYLQPYSEIVHNGVIANDKDFGNYPIDSMVLPDIIKSRRYENALKQISQIKGSYALAYYSSSDIILACNYKPIYYHLGENKIIFASTPDMILRQSTPVPAYSIMKFDYKRGKTDITEIPRKQSNKVLISASAGLDSTTVAYLLQNAGYKVTLCHLLYDCLAENKEIDRIKRIAKHGNFDLVFIDMPKNVMRGTITDGNYHKDQIAGTEYAVDWVSARNLLMLSIMTAYAETNDYGYIAFGGNLEESGAYPDNEQEFGRIFNSLLPYATQNGTKIELLQPVSTLMKHEIVKMGLELNVPHELTWSCYSDNDTHCDNCAPCFMRKTAFERNNKKDPVFK
jgi:7-cyano-7-deazaguanine synthase